MGAECEHTRITRSSQEEPEAGSSRTRILAPGMLRGDLGGLRCRAEDSKRGFSGLSGAGAKEVEGVGPAGGGGF
ncbi:hypothetical protein CDL15_Pgr023250 [Punica granatum]|uniref:Uncharacterized protein n=1 Tax=Punica granatum TaxID=22663 RepID=A0A218X4W6_PUNGR|nr:hypothetical protein CDL15_Pgr023250 [Punica granatum]